METKTKTKKGPRMRWSLPEHLEPWRGSIGTGSYPLEQIMNDFSSLFDNSPKAVLRQTVLAQVGLLDRLYNQGRLLHDDN